MRLRCSDSAIRLPAMTVPDLGTPSSSWVHNAAIGCVTCAQTLARNEWRALAAAVGISMASLFRSHMMVQWYARAGFGGR